MAAGAAAVVGTEDVLVGGQPMPTLLVRDTIEQATPSDSQVTDTWHRLRSDMIVVRTATNATTNSSPIGAVHYNEHVEIRLTSPTPLT